MVNLNKQTAEALIKKGVDSQPAKIGHINYTLDFIGRVPITNVTSATYNISVEDAGKLLVVASASTLTLNDLNVPIGTQIDIFNSSSETVTLAAGTNVTILSESSFLSLATQYTGATLIKTNIHEWLLVGKLS